MPITMMNVIPIPKFSQKELLVHVIILFGAFQILSTFLIW